MVERYDIWVMGKTNKQPFSLNCSIIRLLNGWDIFKQSKIKLSKVIKEVVLVLNGHKGRIQQQDRYVLEKRGSDLLGATGTLHLP